MDHELSLAMTSLNSCIGWLTAVVFLVVGLVPVRKAHATAGYLIAGAGALRWLFYCCESLPETLMEANMYDLVDSLGPLPYLSSMLMWLLSTAVLLGGFAVLARHVTATQLQGGA